MTSIEASRRHGPFDPRRQKRRLRAASRPIPGLEVGLDWDAFSGRYFSGRGRHDLEAISAYEAYQHGRRWRKSSRPKRKRSIALNKPVLTTVGGAPRVATR